MPLCAIREVIRVECRSELGKGEAALRRIFTDCVMLSRMREATVEIAVNGIDMRIYSSPLHWAEDPSLEAGGWMEEYLRRLVREMERGLPSSPASVIPIS